MQPPHLRIRDWHDQLNGIGFAAKYFPNFVQRERQTHTHDIVELNYTFAGSGTQYLGRETVALRPGSLAIIHYTQPHGFITAGADILNLYIDLARFPLPDVGHELQRHLNAVLPPHPSLHHRRHRFVHLHFESGGEFEGVLRRLHDEQQARAPGYREAMQAHLRVALVLCARHVRAHGLATAPGAPPPDDRISEALHALEHDLAAPLDLPRLAAQCSLSVGHLCRAFKRATGATAGDWLARRRIEAAMLALRSGDERPGAMALRLGFADASHFGRTFKRLAGCTPLGYRKTSQG